MLTIVICDDNEVHLQRAASMTWEIAAGSEPEILLYRDTGTLLTDMREETISPDIAVLDIKMDGMDGIALADTVNRILPQCQIIFLSGFADYAPEVYSTEHVWFVLKDRAEEYLPAAIRKALQSISDRETDRVLVFRKDRKTHMVAFDDVIAVERVGRKFRILCRGEIYTDVSLVTDLLDPHIAQQMIRCHQGYWVSEKHIRMLDHNELVMDTGTRVPISRTYRSQVRECFFAARRL